MALYFVCWLFPIFITITRKSGGGNQGAIGRVEDRVTEVLQLRASSCFFGVHLLAFDIARTVGYGQINKKAANFQQSEIKKRIFRNMHVRKKA